MVRRLNGDTKFQTHELDALARLLREDVVEIAKRAGVPLRSLSLTTPLAGYISESGAAVYETASAKSAPASITIPLNTKTLRVRALGPFDGAIVYFGPPVDASGCVGRLCLVEIDGAGRAGVLRRGSSADLYDLTPALGQQIDMLEDLKLQHVEPATLIKL